MDYKEATSAQTKQEMTWLLCKSGKNFYCSNMDLGEVKIRGLSNIDYSKNP